MGAEIEENPLGCTTASHNFLYTLQLPYIGPFCMLYWPLEKSDLAQLLRFVSFQYSSKFPCIFYYVVYSAGCLFILIKVDISSLPTRKNPFSFLHLAGDLWEEVEGLRNNFAFLYLSFLAESRMWFNLIHN